ncbi:MAG: glycoside hydrolase [Bacilli bacterium]|jgi:glucosylceramidase
MKKKVLLVIISSAVVLAAVGTTLGLYYGMRSIDPKLSPYVEVYETTGTKAKLQARQKDLAWRDYEFSGNTEVNVYPQTNKGFFHGAGVAITHSSAYLFQSLSEDQKQYALESLFAHDQGALNVVRIPIGTSDYTNTSSFYTLDDMPSGQKDYDLSHFSLSDDEEYLLPTLLDIHEINPQVIFVAAPWSAPAWMKTNESLIGGSLIGHGENALTDEESAYAAYLVKFVDEYRQRGIKISYLSLINEPTIANVNYPSMQMGTPQYIRVATKVDEGLTAKKSDTKIMAYDHNVGSESDRILFDLFAEEIENSEALKKRISGFAFHAYGKDWSTVYPSLLSDNESNYPAMENYMTEITESDESVDFAANLSWSTANVTIGPLSHGVSMSIYWNALLTAEGEPVLGNEAHCFGMLSADGDIITKSAAYYSFTHLSKFAYAIDGQKPQLIDSLSDNEAKIKSAVYKRADGAYVYVLANNDATTYEDVDVVMDDKAVTYRLQPESIVTLVAPPADAHIDYSESIDFGHIEIVQKSVEQYELLIAMDKPYADVEFRVGASDIYQESEIVSTAKIDESTYKAVLNMNAQDIYLWAISGQKTAFLPLSLPKMQPNVVVEENIATISFGLDIATSWSSFCDPYGKAIYRSSSPLFDETAEQVNVTGGDVVDPIYILEETYQDDNYDDAKPYYFLVMEGKNGLTKFVSYPLVDGTKLFDAPHLTLNNVAGQPILHVTAAIIGSASPSDLKLKIKEVHGESFEIASSSLASLDYQFDCSALTKSGTWYDILIIDKTTDAEYGLPDSAMEKINFTIGQKRYGLKEWSYLAKIAFDNLNYFGAVADLEVTAGVPYLVVDGFKDDENSAELLITYLDSAESSKVTLVTAANEAAELGKFSFAVDLGQLTDAGVYYDIVLNIDSVHSDMTSDMALNIAREIAGDGRVYRFQRWEGYLKVTFSNEV